MSMHIEAEYGMIAEDVIMPGDPLRAKYIADTYLEDAVCINKIRGMWGFTGYYRGHRVTVMGSGMGIPSIMIYATELYREYGVKRIIRLGTCGGVRESLKINDIVLSQATSTTSGINTYALPGIFAPVASFDLLMKAYNCSREMGLDNVYVGNTLSNDHLYVDNKLEYSRKWEAYGILVSEQECAGLYTVANKEKGEALMIGTVVVNLYHPEEEMPAEQREKGLNKAIELALNTLLMR